MAKIGYARVSTNDQDAALQIEALETAGVDPNQIFIDEGISGTKASRPQLDAMLDYLREGDTVVIWKFDRLGRSVKNMLDLIEAIEYKGCNFESLTEKIDTTGPMGKAMLTIMSAFGQLERDQIAERTKAGLAAAAKNNRHGGRPRKVDDQAVQDALQWKQQGMSVNKIAKYMGVSRATVYRYLRDV